MKNKIRLKVNLINSKTDRPIPTKEYKVNFWDHDIVKDDYLGSVAPDEHGNALITVNRADIRSFDSPFEKKPDIYFTVEKDHNIIYKSLVLENLNLDKVFDYADFTEYCYDLGSFTI